jgi:hypothetical protein
MPQIAALCGGNVNQTATSDFGHFRAEVPKSLHIGAHPHVFVIAAARRAVTKPLQAVTFAARGSRGPL